MTKQAKMKFTDYKRWRQVGGGLVVALTLLGAAPMLQAAAVRVIPGFTPAVLPANDDGSVPTAVPIGFTANFFGTNFTAVFVNNNGNVTLDRTLSTFTPFGLTGTVAQIIAPFFADVDTRGVGSGLTSYGQTTVGTRRAFIVNWINVGYFSSGTDRLNSFQLVLIDRADLGAGDFDIEFNYDRIQWEAGSASGGMGGLGGNPARAGFSNGSTLPGTFFELAGSGVVGGFLDGNLSTGLIRRSLNSSVPGRYLFRVRSGLVDFGGLTMSVVADPNPASIGSNVTFRVRVDNTFTNEAIGLVLSNQLPASLIFQSATASQGTATNIANGVVVALGTLPAGSAATLNIIGTPTTIGEFCNVVSLIATSGAALQAEACITVIPGRTHGQCITRNARYWFTHTNSDDPECAALLGAIEANGGRINLGFLDLPIEYRNADNRLDGVDALIEALGLYWRSTKRTGEADGTQSAKIRASALCRARKELAVEIIAAQANFVYLGTYPTDCYYDNGLTVTNFAVDFVERAKDVASGTDLELVRVHRALLRQFNNTGLTNNFFGGLKECTATSTKILKQVARDPVSALTCPGFNDQCDTAEEIIATALPYRKSVDLTKFADDVGSPDCETGGADAIWVIRPPTGALNRQFTVTSGGSNIGTVLSVWQFGCDALTPIACVTGNPFDPVPPQLSFRTDGTNQFFIVAEGAQGAIGSLKLKVTSP